MNEIIKKLPWNKKLEVLRVALGLTQTELAERCYTNQKIYWSWESGNTYPRKISREKLAQIFGVLEDEIFSTEDKTKNSKGV